MLIKTSMLVCVCVCALWGGKNEVEPQGEVNMGRGGGLPPSWRGWLSVQSVTEPAIYWSNSLFSPDPSR